MTRFDPVKIVENSSLVLDQGLWPNFHDAELHQLLFQRGDVRPEENVWVGTRIEATFELCALQYPYRVVLHFHDCDAIRMQDFNHQNALFDLTMHFVSRGHDLQGSPLTPYISVKFEQAFGVELCFNCFRIEAVSRLPVWSDY